MTTVAYALGRPHAAAQRGGDCRARDLDQARNVHGPHRFAATTHCQISNGLLRLTVGASGIAPTLTVEAYRGRVTVGDTYESVYRAKYSTGSISSPAWLAMGFIIIDSPTVTSLLTAVRIVRISPEAVTVRLVVPALTDAFVTLRRGERQIRVQHGSTQAPRLTTDRQVRWWNSGTGGGFGDFSVQFAGTAPQGTLPPTGTAYSKRVVEVNAAPDLDGFHRYVGAVDPATASTRLFAMRSTGVTTARFAAGVGTTAPRDGARDMHNQLGDASRPQLVVA